MKYFLYLLTVVFLLSSCKKKGKSDFVLNGIITDTSFGIPHSGASIKLYETIPGSNSENLLGTTSTNSSGQYSFTFPRNSALSYRVNCVKNNYFDLNEIINFSDLTIENDNVRDYTTTAKSWVNLHFVNEAPSNAIDEVKFHRIAGKSNCDLCCPSGEISIVGIVDTSIYCINDGNTSYTYTYSISGTTVIGDKTAVTTAFDTTEILLTY